MVNFKNPQESHEHSLKTLNTFYEYDDFMESIGRVLDIGCGQEALDLLWWANATTRDETPRPLNIQCTGVDLLPRIVGKHPNLAYNQIDAEAWDTNKKPYDIIWCHDTFQYLLNPLETLKKWRTLCAKDGMLVLIFPQTTNVEFNQQAFEVPSGVYYNHTMVSLIYMLAVNGWDCRGGFFKKDPNDPWIHAVVYNSDQPARDPRTTTWYNLSDAGLLPKSVEESILKYGYPRQRDLLLPWLDHSLMWMGQQ